MFIGVILDVLYTCYPPLSRDVYIGYEVKVFIGVILGVLYTCYPP